MLIPSSDPSSAEFLQFQALALWSSHRWVDTTSFNTAIAAVASLGKGWDGGTFRHSRGSSHGRLGNGEITHNVKLAISMIYLCFIPKYIHVWVFEATQTSIGKLERCSDLATM